MTTWPVIRPEETPAPAAKPLRPGRGTTITASSLGVAISTPNSGPTFQHPWRPSLQTSSLVLVQGTVYSLGGDGVYIPKIRVKGKLISMVGDQNNPPPVLKLDSSIANKNGESWVVLEVECDDASGEILKTSRLEILHTSEPLSHQHNVARQPLTQILWQNGRPLRAIAVTHWNLRYLRLTADESVRHLFL